VESGDPEGADEGTFTNTVGGGNNRVVFVAGGSCSHAGQPSQDEEGGGGEVHFYGSLDALRVFVSVGLRLSLNLGLASTLVLSVNGQQA